MLRSRRPDVHDLAGPYALDAVTPADRARFEHHLAGCPPCAEEIAEFREVTARLAGAAATEPPAEVIAATLAVAAGTRQLAPVTGPSSPRQAAGHGRPATGQNRRAGWRPRSLARPAVAMALVLLAGAGTLGGVALRAEHRAAAAGQRAGADEQRGYRIARVLTAPDAHMLTARIRAGGTATVVMSHHDRTLVFTTAGLPRLPATRCYQLWLMGPSGDRSVGMLPHPRNGMTSPVVASGLAAGDRVGLTIEPDGGTRQPTTAPILLLALAD